MLAMAGPASSISRAMIPSFPSAFSSMVHSEISLSEMFDLLVEVDAFRLRLRDPPQGLVEGARFLSQGGFLRPLAVYAGTERGEVLRDLFFRLLQCRIDDDPRHLVFPRPDLRLYRGDGPVGLQEISFLFFLQCRQLRLQLRQLLLGLLRFQKRSQVILQGGDPFFGPLHLIREDPLRRKQLFGLFP